MIIKMITQIQNIDLILINSNNNNLEQNINNTNSINDHIGNQRNRIRNLFNSNNQNIQNNINNNMINNGGNNINNNNQQHNIFE